jgi:hypothetical protein
MNYQDIYKIAAENKVKNLCISMDDFTEIYQMEQISKNTFVSFIGQRNILQRGLYVFIYNTLIWVNKYIPAGYIRLYPENEQPLSSLGQKDKRWSRKIKISDLDKYLKLKMFW